MLGCYATLRNGTETVFMVIAHDVRYYGTEKVDEYGVVAAAGEFAMEGEVFLDSRVGVGTFL